MLTGPEWKSKGSSRSKSWGQVASRTPVTEVLPKRLESGKKLKANIKYLEVLPRTDFESRKNSSLFIMLLQGSTSGTQTQFTLSTHELFITDFMGQFSL